MKTCIGGSTYAEFVEGGHICLFLDNGHGPQNMIHIEPQHWDRLVAFRDSQMKPAANLQKDDRPRPAYMRAPA